MNLKLKLAIDYYVGGAIHVLIKPVVYTLGKVLRRDHSLTDIDEITVIKMLGGGSVVIAYPSLLAIKKKHPQMRINLVTTAPIKPFADLLGFFDEVIVLRDDNAVHLALDSLRALVRLWRAKALVDLEIHSRLSAIFTLLTCARNRIGIYTDASFWRISLYTHLLFYNKYAPVYSLYDQVAQLFGAEEADFQQAKAAFSHQVGQGNGFDLPEGNVALGIAPGCSDLGKERMLSAEQWVTVLEKRCALQDNLVLVFIGAGRDKALSENICSGLRSKFPELEFRNTCGQHNLRDSVRLMSHLDALYCIDSGLIHFARLLGTKTISYWGPTDPASRLRHDAVVPEEVHYVRLTCSPCVHIVAEAPCLGNNICITASIELENYTGERNPCWLAK